MKKIILCVALLSGGAMLINSCQKEKLNKFNSSSRTNDKIEYRLDNIPLIKYVPEEEEKGLLDGIIDLDEIKLNNQLIALEAAMRELCKNKSFNEKVVALAKESNVETVYLSQLVPQFPDLFAQVDQLLGLKGLSLSSITANMTHMPRTPNLAFPETGLIEIYEPAFLVPNCEIANTNLNPLISANVEVIYNEEDCIVANYFDANGNVHSTVVNEQTATNTTNPVFILNHAIPKAKMDAIGRVAGDAKKGTGVEKSGNTEFRSDRIQIKAGYRYESGLGGRSEFCLAGVIVRAESPPVNFLHLTNNNDQSLKIKEITRSQVNNSSFVNVTSHHADNYTPYADHKVYWNTFERDWNRSVQDWGHGSDFGQEWAVWGRARYSEDWYTWIPSTVNIHETPFDWFGWVTEIPYDNWKSFYNIKKVN